MEALALTDVNGLYGAVRFQKACEERDIEPIFGAEVSVAGAPIVLLAASRGGYANLCSLLTEAHLRDRAGPSVRFSELEAHSDDLFCLTGTDRSALWSLLEADRTQKARRWIEGLASIFGARLSIEICHHLRPGDNRRLNRLEALSNETGIPLVATGDVRYARPSAYQRYDLMTCIRHGQPVFEGASCRPPNAEAHFKSQETLSNLIPYPRAFERAGEIAQACNVDLLPGHITPPEAHVGDTPPETQLRKLCRQGLRERYEVTSRGPAERQLQTELQTITDLELEEFFLVVHEIVEEARRRGIRCAGRGSAANSIVAYLLGITGVDPIEHDLLFERFLHRGRKGTPDIDVDFDTERRDEIIDWMEQRFGLQHTAMTATVVTYKLRSALRDTAKALGWPLDKVDALTKAVPRRRASRVREYTSHIKHILGDTPLVEVLIERVYGLDKCPRHLGLHVGGMILSRRPLNDITPVQESANGVRMIQFDKDDAEALGLVKFDVLGLRMLSTLSEAVELTKRHTDPDFELGDVPVDDTQTFNMMRAGKTLGCFQIESQGQLRLLAQHQPDNFGDLITQIALFRPGPLQSGMVHPFIRRRRGREPVQYDHPILEPILRDTYGVIVFQEQVLEVAHRFAGMSLSEADDFRQLMSKFRDPGEMEKMRTRFVEGAKEQGIDEKTAHTVFDQVSNFVGYGFCRSHAAAFAKTVYQSAYLKRHHPAAFMAAVMQHRPGMYNLMTLQEEAERFGVQTLPPHLRRSGVRYDLEPIQDGEIAIRKPLSAVESVSAEEAQKIVWERLNKPFKSIEDFYRRVKLDIDVFRNLARSGALDHLAGSSREALWRVGLLDNKLGEPGQSKEPTLFDLPTVQPKDIPELPSLSEEERLSWDYQTHRAARRHPMRLVRRNLTELEVRPIETCYRFGRYIRQRSALDHPPLVTIAGLAVLRQQPPTANGVMFLMLEDETGFLQCIARPQVQQHLDHVLPRSALIVRGRLHIEGNWRGVVIENAWPLNGIFGGYEGHPSNAGGRDNWIRRLRREVPADDLPERIFRGSSQATSPFG